MELWIAWWTGLPGGTSRRGKLYVVIFMRLGGAYRLGEIFKSLYGGQATKPHLGIGWGLGWMKWLKMGQIKVLYFMQLLLQYILFGENFIGKGK